MPLKIDLTEYSNRELSLQVYNDEHLYNLRYDPFDDLKRALDRRFLFTDAQWIELLKDVSEQMTEDLRQMWEANNPGGNKGSASASAIFATCIGAITTATARHTGTKQKINLTEYSDRELSLQVFNDEYLYGLRYIELRDLLNERFLFTDAQWVELLKDLSERMTEDEKTRILS
jgi:hypothetical protein